MQPARGAKAKLSSTPGLPWWPRWQRICLPCRRHRFCPWVRKILWRREWLPTPVFLPGKSHKWRSLVGCSPWGRKVLDTTERLIHAHNWFQSIHAQPLYQLPPYVLKLEAAALEGSWWSWNKDLQEQEDPLTWRNIHVLLSHYLSCDSEAVSVGQKAQDKLLPLPHVTTKLRVAVASMSIKLRQVRFLSFQVYYL